mgnify:CR=1 FL=1
MTKRRAAAQHRSAATDYVYRHVPVDPVDPEAVFRPVHDVLLVIAYEANAQGRSRITQPMIAAARKLSIKTIEKHMRALLRPTAGKPWLEKGGGRTYILRGFAEHDPQTCPLIECQADAKRK